MSIPLRRILSRKGWGATSVSAADPLLHIADVLVQNRIGAVVVLDKQGRLLGLVSERDIVTGLSRRHQAAEGLTANDIMSVQIQTCSPDCTLGEAMRIMTTFRQRHVPVVEDGRLLGLVSIGDVVKYRLEEADHSVEEMRAYVMQSGPRQDHLAG